MITGECFKGYITLLINIVDMCSDNTTLKAVKFVSTDERYKAVQKIFDKNLSEADFLKELEKLGV